MSRDVGRYGSTREATVLLVLPHLQQAVLPGTTANPPAHLWQPGPQRGGAAM